MDARPKASIIRNASPYIVSALLGLGMVLVGAQIFEIFFPSSNLPRHSGFARVHSIDADDRVLGERGAPIQVIVFFNPECPYCKSQHEETIPLLLDEFAGKIAVAYRHAFISIFPDSKPEMEAIECAAIQKGEEAYWAYVQALYSDETSGALSSEALAELAESLGLDRAAFTQCLASGTARPRVEKDTREAALAGINATPTTIIRSSQEDVMIDEDDIVRMRTTIKYLLALEEN